jgi:carboxymethylenebutenolidase
MADAASFMTMADGARIEVYRSAPKAPRRGGLVLVQEIFGLTDHIREQCDRFAAEGYEVLAPAIFDREAPGLRASYATADVELALRIARDQHPFNLSVTDVAACVRDLQSRGPVFLVGYCYGASVSWATACRIDGVTAASCYYGSHIARMAAEQPRCPTILHFGIHDAGIPPSEVETLRLAHPALDIFTYDAGHGFNSDRRDDYHEPSATKAWERTLALFQAGTA